jgi:polyisoprenoid-binding protein YceI
MKTILLLPFAFTLIAVPSTPIAAAQLGRGPNDWSVDAGHSSVVFKVRHANAAWFKGSFDVIQGVVTLDAKTAEPASVQLTIPVASVDSNDQKRDDHLKAPDFFNAKENPEITFASTRIAKAGDGFAVTGTLAMAGKQQAITIPVEKVGEGEFYGRRIGYTSTFTIKRSDFGMTYGVDKNVLGDEVTLMIDLELVAAK